MLLPRTCPHKNTCAHPQHHTTTARCRPRAAAPPLLHHGVFADAAFAGCLAPVVSQHCLHCCHALQTGPGQYGPATRSGLRTDGGAPSPCHVNILPVHSYCAHDLGVMGWMLLVSRSLNPVFSSSSWSQLCWPRVRSGNPRGACAQQACFAHQGAAAAPSWIYAWMTRAGPAGRAPLACPLAVWLSDQATQAHLTRGANAPSSPPQRSKPGSTNRHDKNILFLRDGPASRLPIPPSSPQ